jgi:hypothetical protein
VSVEGSKASDGDGFVPYIAHDEFKVGAAHGNFRVVVNPTLARGWVVQRTHVNVLAISLIGVGAALALAGSAVAGVVLVGLGIGANRLVRTQAGKIVLHLAVRDPAVYAEVTTNGVMEVTRAA